MFSGRKRGEPFGVFVVEASREGAAAAAAKLRWASGASGEERPLREFDEEEEVAPYAVALFARWCANGIAPLLGLLAVRLCVGRCPPMVVDRVEKTRGVYATASPAIGDDRPARSGSGSLGSGMLESSTTDVPMNRPLGRLAPGASPPPA